MEIRSNNAQTFTGFKLLHKTADAAKTLTEDIMKINDDSVKATGEKLTKLRQECMDLFHKDIIEPLKEIKSDVIYDAADKRITVVSPNAEQQLTIRRGKIAPLHPSIRTIVQYPVESDTGFYTVDYGKRELAEQAAKDVQWNIHSDFVKAREIAKYFDALEAQKAADLAVKNAEEKMIEDAANKLFEIL